MIAVNDPIPRYNYSKLSLLTGTVPNTLEVDE